MDDYPVDLIRKGAVEFVFTTHVTNQQLFFVHVENRTKILDDIMDKLATRYSDLKHNDKLLHNKRLGSLCAAKFTDDNNWYRAKITGLMKNGLIEVHFVDYGNIDYVSEDRIKAIDPDLVMYPVQSYRCSLANVSSPQGFWTPESIIQFEDRVVDKRCRAVFLSESDNDEVYMLQLFDGDCNINQLFGAAVGAEDHTVQNGICLGVGFTEAVLEVGTVIQATVVYAKSPGLFWCQDTAFVSDILIMSEELSSMHMTQDIKPLRSVSRGTVCAAKSSEDEAWYRGVVQEVSGHTATVYFVDYGNTETVSLDVICILRPEMRSLQILGIKCRLAGVEKKGTEWRHEVTEAFEQLALDKEFEVKVVGRERDVYVVTLLDIVENKDVGAQLRCITGNLKSEIPARDMNSNKPSAVSAVGPSIDTGSKVNVFLSWIESPGDFWVQLSDDEALLEKLSQQLQQVYAEKQPLARLSPGAFVVARFSQDHKWYRSLVLKDFEDGRVQVLFIDYGNSDILPVTELRHVTPEFGKVIPLASRCCLAGVKPLRRGDNSWTTDARDFLEKLTENGCQCEVLNKTHSHKLVKLKVGSQDVAKELLDMGVVADAMPGSKTHCPSFVRETNLRKSETETAVVVHIDSPQSFWCQLRRNIPSLSELTKKISTHYTDNEGACIKSPTIGQACIVMYGKSHVWYRATIINAMPSLYSVYFVDYGNTDMVPKNTVYVPEPRFLDLPTQAVHCSLPVSDDLNHLTDVLKEAILDKELQLQVLDVLNEITVVELFDGKLQVSERLKLISRVPKQADDVVVDFKPAKTIPVGSSVEAFASVVISPSKFFIQMSGTDEVLDALMDSITQLCFSDDPPPSIINPHIGQACVAFYSEDDQWYRGRITAVMGGKCTVLFVDYGNEDTVKLENIKVLTPDIARLPVMAYQCSLHGVPETVWSESAHLFFEALIIDQKLDCTFVTPNSVRVSCGAKNVASLLVNAGHCKANETVLPPRQNVSSKETDAGLQFGTDSQRKKTDSGDVDNVRRGGDPKSYICHDDRDSDRHFGAEHKNEATGGKQREASNGGSSGGRNDKNSRFETDSGKSYGKNSGYTDYRNSEKVSGFPDNRNSGRDSGFADNRDSGFADNRNSGKDSGSANRHSGLDSGFSEKRNCGKDSGYSGNRHSGFSDNRHSGKDSGLSDNRHSGFSDNRNYGESRFGGGRKDEKTSSDSVSAAADFTYADIPSEPESAILVHMDESGVFYIQLPSMEKDILFLSKRIASRYKNSGGPRLKEAPAKGTICCAKFSGDGYMYRARIEDLYGSTAVLRYVDYGNTGQCNTSDLKFLFSDLLEYPVQAFPCTLRGYHWSLDQAEKFAKATLDKDIKVSFTRSSCPFQIDIMTPDGDLLKILTGSSAPPANELSTQPSGASPRSVGSGNKSQPSGLSARSTNTSGCLQKLDASTAKKTLTSNQSSEVSPSIPRQQFLSPSAPLGALAAFISHIGKDGYFYLQLARDTATLESISEKLVALPENIAHPNPSQGASCAALFSEDSSWYRAVITDTASDNLSVLFVDYGNEDSVNIRSVKPLSGDLLSLAPLAYRSQFPDVGPLSPEAQAKLGEYLMEHQVTVNLSGSSPPFDVSIKAADGKDLQEVICPPKQYKAPSIPTEVTPAGVTVIEDDGRFFLQIYQEYKAVRELQAELAAACETRAAETVESLEVGMPYCLKLDNDSWERCKLVELTSERAHILLVDTGKTIVTDAGCLHTLPSQFLKKPPFALECRLKGVESWVGDLRSKFTDMTQDKILNATFYSKTPPFSVSLARSIELDLLGLAAPPENSPQKKPSSTALTTIATVLKPDSDECGRTAYISHVQPDGTFYTQTADDDLSHFAERLEVLLSGSSDVGEVGVGDVVCARFTEDDCWYRAQIESCDVDSTYNVRFVDYGNSDLVGADRLTVLPDSLDLALVPPFAVKSRLFGVPDDLTSKQLDELQEALADQTVRITFRRDVQGVQEVDVSLGGVDVTHKLGLKAVRTSGLDKKAEGSDTKNECTKVAGDVDKTEDVQHTEQAVATGDNMDGVKSSHIEQAVVTGDNIDGVKSSHIEQAVATGDNIDGVKSSHIEQAVVTGDNIDGVKSSHIEQAVATGDNIDGVKSSHIEQAVATGDNIDGVKSNHIEQAVATGDNIDGVKSSHIKQAVVTGDNIDGVKSSHIEQAVATGDNIDGVKSSHIEQAVATGDNIDGVKSSHIDLQCVSSELVAEVDVTSIQRATVNISFTYSPDRFYLQLKDNKAGLNGMMDALFEYFSSQPEDEASADDFEVGDICAALFEDESWYRVKIHNVVEDGTYQIFYMDYGNTETAERSSLRHIPEKFKSISPMALKAKLGGVGPSGGSWSDEVLHEFKDMVENKCMLADIVAVEEGGAECVVHLLYLGIPVSDELIRKGYAVAGEDVAVSSHVQHFFSDSESSCTGSKTEELIGCLESTHLEGDSRTAKETMISCEGHAHLHLGCVSSSLHELEEVEVYVSHSVSPSHFWCQLSAASDVLSDISNLLISTYGSLPEEGTITGPVDVGDAVVAVFADDGKLYRANVVSVRPVEGEELAQKVVVSLMDYGNECETSQSQLHQFDDSLCSWPAQAFSCHLDKLQPVGSGWSPEACLKFSEIVTDQKLFLKLVGREQDGTALVDLVLTETGQSVLTLMVESGLAASSATETRPETSANNSETIKVMDVSEMEYLEMTQPIMESTGMVLDVTRGRSPTFTFLETDDAQFRSVRLSLHTEYDVTVSNDELPSCFHVQLLETRAQYQSLMAEIANHVASDLNLNMADFKPDHGDACLVQHCGVWYRGLVTARESSSWNVESVDCGWEVNVSPSELKPLPGQFKELAAQAVPCYLAGVVSVEPEWATDGIAFFIESVREANLCMYVLENADDGKYGVYLSDLDVTGSHSVNRAMVDLDYAEVVPGSNIEVQIEMERTLDTNKLQDLEESFNEVSQMKHNPHYDSDTEAVQTTADRFNCDTPFGDVYGDSENSRTVEIYKNICHLDQVSKSLVTSHDSEQAVQLNSEQATQLTACSMSSADGLPSKFVEFNFASAVERIDQMGCLDNYPDEGISTDDEGQDDVESEEGRDVSGGKLKIEGQESNSSQFGGDVPRTAEHQENISHNKNGADEQICSQTEGKLYTPELEPACIDRSCTADLNQGKASSENTGTCQEEAVTSEDGQNALANRTDDTVAQDMEPVHCVKNWIIERPACYGVPLVMADDSYESIEIRMNFESSTGDSTCLVRSGMSRSESAKQHELRSLRNSEELLGSEQVPQTLLGKQLIAASHSELHVVRSADLEGISLPTASLHTPGQAQNVTASRVTVQSECGDGDAKRMQSGESSFDVFNSCFMSCSASAEDTTTEDYESCCEEISQDLEVPEGEMSSCLTEGSWLQNESNYDTSSLVFSDSCEDLSMDISSLCVTSATETSGLDSDATYYESDYGDTSTSSSSDTNSTSSSGSTIVTSPSLSDDDIALWELSVTTTSSLSDSSVFIFTDTSSSSTVSDSDSVVGSTKHTFCRSDMIGSLSLPVQQLRTSNQEDSGPKDRKLGLQDVSCETYQQQLQTTVVIVGDLRDDASFHTSIQSTVGQDVVGHLSCNARLLGEEEELPGISLPSKESTNEMHGRGMDSAADVPTCTAAQGSGRTGKDAFQKDALGGQFCELGMAESVVQPCEISSIEVLGGGFISTIFSEGRSGDEKVNGSFTVCRLGGSLGTEPAKPGVGSELEMARSLGTEPAKPGDGSELGLAGSLGTAPAKGVGSELEMAGSLGTEPAQGVGSELGMAGSLGTEPAQGVGGELEMAGSLGTAPAQGVGSELEMAGSLGTEPAQGVGSELGMAGSLSTETAKPGEGSELGMAGSLGTEPAQGVGIELEVWTQTTRVECGQN